MTCLVALTLKQCSFILISPRLLPFDVQFYVDLLYPFVDIFYFLVSFVVFRYKILALAVVEVIYCILHLLYMHLIYEALASCNLIDSPNVYSNAMYGFLNTVQYTHKRVLLLNVVDESHYHVYVFEAKYRVYFVIFLICSLHAHSPLYCTIINVLFVLFICVFQ